MITAGIIFINDFKFLSLKNFFSYFSFREGEKPFNSRARARFFLTVFFFYKGSLGKQS